MKYYLLKGISFCFIIVGTSALAQDNTLPSTGNVGIGTLSPSARLDVNGNMKVDSCLHVKDSVLIEDNARIMSDMRVEGETTLLGNVKVEGDMYLTNLTYDSTFTGKIMLVDANGKLIGGGTGDDFSDLVYSKVCQVDVGGNYPNPQWNNGLNKIFINCPPVRVGIGTDVPRTKLDVIGGIYSNTLAIGKEPSTIEAKVHIRSVSSTSSNNPVMIIENESTLSNLTKRIFQVNSDGLLRAREVLIDAVAWPDYVFEEKYPLMSLPEVESFINKNGHLPDVPSEAEVAEEGISVAKMNAILLQKIEELTLHLIEQEKRIKELEEALNK